MPNGSRTSVPSHGRAATADDAAPTPVAPAAEAPPPTVPELVSRILLHHVLRRNGVDAGIAFGGARMDGDVASVTLLMRTRDGRAYGATETVDPMGDPLATLEAMRRRAEAGEVGEGLLPALDALRSVTRPFGGTTDAGDFNSPRAVGIALRALREAGHAEPRDARRYVEGRQAATRATALIARAEALFEATLDPKALALVASRRCKLAGLAVPGTWEALDATFTPGAPLRDLVEARPGLARAIAVAYAENPKGLEAAREADAVEAFVAARSGLPRRLCASVAMASAAAGTLPEAELPYAPGDADPVLHWVGKLASLPREWVPDHPDEWVSYLRCQRAVDWARERTTDPEAAARILGGAPRWTEVERALSHACDGEGLRRGLDAVDPMGRAFASQVAGPAMHLAGIEAGPRDRAGQAAAAALESGRTLAAVIADAVWWRAVRDGLDAQVAAFRHGAEGVSSWQGGIPDGSYKAGTHGDFAVVVLKDRDALVEEGFDGANPDGTEGLCHDLAARAGDCADGRCRVVSLRRVADGEARERLSTAVVGYGMKGLSKQFMVEAHLGPGGEAPDALSASLLAKYVEDVQAGRLGPVDDMAFVPVAIRKDVSQAAGYDVDAPGQWHAARDLWADFVPEAALHMDPEEMGHALLAGVDGKDPRPGTSAWEPARFGSGGWPATNRAPAP